MTKTISLSDDAYAALAGLKQPGESFSDVALRLAHGQRTRSILEFAGAWKRLGMTEKEAERVKQAVYKRREESVRTRRERG
jgi:predicted CopG family antitoxin